MAWQERSKKKNEKSPSIAAEAKSNFHIAPEPGREAGKFMLSRNSNRKILTNRPERRSISSMCNKIGVFMVAPKPFEFLNFCSSSFHTA